jgi:mannose-6-phosphate isomerase-like protein (cupin superfamily)
MSEDQWTIEHLFEESDRGGQRYLEFLRIPSLSAGIYCLPAGATDPQSPHSEDEVYVVLRGRGRFQCGGRDRSVSTGSVLLVRAHEDHRFHSIEEELRLLVVFGPAETASA